MKENNINILNKDLVLMGAGHSNIEVLRSFGKKPIKGLRITLVTNKLEAIYSGMIPGYIEGIYNWSEIVIDLIKLSYAYNFRLIHAEVIKIDKNKKKIYFKNRCPLQYDFLSINTGIKSKNASINIKNNALSLKPISGIKSLVQKTIKELVNNNRKLVLIGAGAAGVEVAIAFRKRLNKLKIKNDIILLSNKEIILENYNNSVRKICISELKKNKIKILYNVKITRISKNFLDIRNKRINNTFAILSTSSVPPDYLKKSNLPLTRKGYLNIQNTLQIRGVDNIFASGDIAEISGYKNIKAGVFAVNQGKILHKNIRNFISNKNLKFYIPQKFYLSLIGLGNGNALANKYYFTMKGSLFWKIKKIIDKRFIKKYTLSDRKKIEELNNSIEPFDKKMQCEGCGNKIPQTVLDKVFNDSIRQGSKDAERIPHTKNLYHTVDIISSIVKDPFLLGKIAAKHAINDLFVTSSKPQTAQMIIGLPPAKNEINLRDLDQIKQGAKTMFDELKCQISGGHSFSYNGDQIMVGFSIIGKEEKLKNYKPLKNGKIYITGHIGSALVFAAIKEKKISGIHYENVIENMQASNNVLHKILIKNNIYIKTDISGFGIAIHLYNLFLRYSFLKGADIFLERIPLFTGAKLALEESIKSSLNDSNRSFIINKLNIKNKNPKLLNSLFDPQTAGGFIFICKENSEDLINQLIANKINFTHIGNINNSEKLNIL